MKKIQNEKYNFLKVVALIFCKNLLYSFKKISIHIFGVIYFLIFICFDCLIIITSKTKTNPDYMAWNMLLNIFSTFILFIFSYFVVNILFLKSRKNGFLKIEQREGVPLFVSFISRILSSYVLIIAYQIPLIIIWNIVFYNSSLKNIFYSAGVVNLINYQPLITIFILGILIFLINIFNELLSILSTFFLSIIYSVSPIVSIYILDKNNTLSKTNVEINNLLSNIKLGKNFYDYISENNIIDSYDVNYFSILDDLYHKNGGNDELSIEKPSDLYRDLNSIDMIELFSFGDLYEIQNKNSILNELENWSFFNQFIEPIFKYSNNIKNEGEYKNYFIKENSIFSENFNLINYKNYLNDMLNNENLKKDLKIYNLINFMSKNIDNLINVYNYTRPIGVSWSGYWNNSAIAMGNYKRFDNVYQSEQKLEKNYMLDTLIWEILTYYNLSLSPIMLQRNQINNYDELKQFENDKYNYFDSLFIFNHIYLISNFVTDNDSLKTLKFNSYYQNPVTSKCVAKPFKINFLNDDELEIMFKKEICDPSNPYSKTINYSISKNFNISLVRFLYPLTSILFILCTYFLFKSRILI